MPRVHSQRANKDYKDIGVKKGERYFWWKKRFGPKQRSKTYPRASQLSNAKYAVVYDAIEDAKMAVAATDDPQEMKDAVETCGQSARDVGQEYSDSADNMESVFSGGSPTIDECREKQEACEAFADECESFEPDTSAFEDLGDEPVREKGQSDAEHAALVAKWDTSRQEALDEIRGEADGILDGFQL